VGPRGALVVTKIRRNSSLNIIISNKKCYISHIMEFIIYDTVSSGL
jgi:hypothetical protein